MNSSELLRRRQQAANVYKSYWQPRDASEVVYRNGAKANNNTLPNSIQTSSNPPALSNYAPPPPLPGSTKISNGNNNQPRYACDTFIGPGNGFSPTYEYTTVLNRKVGQTVCGDVAWGASGGICNVTCSAITSILNPVSACNAYSYLPNPIPGMTWTTASNGVLFAQLTGDCPPNNSAQTPHFASNPRWLPYYNPLDVENTSAVPITTYGAYTPKNRL
jgi:hypothetical protein